VAAIRAQPVWPLVLTSLAIMGSPGPATISLTAAGSAYGVRRSIGYLLGIIAGTTVVLFAVALLLAPPLTEDSLPLALPFAPPLTEASSPLAVFFWRFCSSRG